MRGFRWPFAGRAQGASARPPLVRRSSGAPSLAGERTRLVPRLTLALIAVLAVQLVADRPRRRFPARPFQGRRSSPVALDRRGAWLQARLPVERGAGGCRDDLERRSALLRHARRLEDGRFCAASGRRSARALLRAAGMAARTAGSSPAPRRSPCRSRACSSRGRRTLAAKLFADGPRACSSRRSSASAACSTLYLTLAPYGGNLEGVRAASLAYFGKEPDTLTPAEAALLVALPQSPEARRPDRHPGAPPARRATACSTGSRRGASSAPTTRPRRSASRSRTRAGLPRRSPRTPPSRPAPPTPGQGHPAHDRRRLQAPLEALAGAARRARAEAVGGDPGGRRPSRRGSRPRRLRRPRRRGARRRDRHDPGAALARLGAEAASSTAWRSTTASPLPRRCWSTGRRASATTSRRTSTASSTATVTVREALQIR